MTVATFKAKAPGIMRKLMSDFGLDVKSAAAILGNLGHESGGLTSLQEIRPTVAGSRGGYGWAQWTGPRRRAYEAYCARNHLSPSSDQANYGFLFAELSGDYAGAIRAVKAAKEVLNKNGSVKKSLLRAKVEAFELQYERAGIKGYDSRETWAKRALAAYASDPTAIAIQTAPSSGPKKAATSAVVAGTAAAGAAAQTAGFDYWLLIPIIIVGISIAVVTWLAWPRKDAVKV